MQNWVSVPGHCQNRTAHLLAQRGEFSQPLLCSKIQHLQWNLNCRDIEGTAALHEVWVILLLLFEAERKELEWSVGEVCSDVSFR